MLQSFSFRLHFRVFKAAEHIIFYKYKNEAFLSKPTAIGSVYYIPTTKVPFPFSATTFYQETFRKDFHVRVFHTGVVQWSFGGQVSTLCGLDMTYFPFDMQKCVIQLENWAYHGNEVKLRNNSQRIITTHYEAHGIWDLVYTSSEWKNIFFEATGDEPYPEVDFTMYLSRKSQFYVLNLVFPCLIVIIVALGIFWLPAESGEKVSLGVTLMLAFSVLQVVLADSTPINSDYNPVLSKC